MLGPSPSNAPWRACGGKEGSIGELRRSLNEIFESYAFRLIFSEPFFRGFLVGKDLEVVDIADFLGRVDVDENSFHLVPLSPLGAAIALPADYRVFREYGKPAKGGRISRRTSPPNPAAASL